MKEVTKNIVNLNYIRNSRELIKTLKQMEENFITVEADGREYIIDKVTRKPNYSNSLSTHICLVCRDGGQGEVKR